MEGETVKQDQSGGSDNQQSSVFWVQKNLTSSKRHIDREKKEEEKAYGGRTKTAEDKPHK